MNLQTFRAGIVRTTPPGTVLDNPGRGTSSVLSYSSAGITYLRGRSKIYVAFADLFAAYSRFKGDRVSATDLKAFSPPVFDSKGTPPGHSCNCTFLFLLLQNLGLASSTHGRGVRGDPYCVDIPA
jgi:hypothetical protein